MIIFSAERSARGGATATPSTRGTSAATKRRRTTRTTTTSTIRGSGGTLNNFSILCHNNGQLCNTIGLTNCVFKLLMIRSDFCFSCDIFPTSVVGSVPAAATALPPAVQSISYALSTRQHQHHQQHAHAQYYGNCHVSDTLLVQTVASDLYKMTKRLSPEIQKI